MSLNLELSTRPVMIERDAVERLPATSRTAEALGDLAAGFARRWIWSKLASYQDILLRSPPARRPAAFGGGGRYLILIVTLGVSRRCMLFKNRHAGYVPYVMLGLLTWQFISER